MVSVTFRPLSPQEITPVLISKKAKWTSGSVWTGMENTKRLAPTGVQTPYRPVRSESLRQERYSAPKIVDDFKLPSPQFRCTDLISLPTFRKNLLEIRNYVGMCFKPLLTKKMARYLSRFCRRHRRWVCSNFVSEMTLCFKLIIYKYS